MLMYTSCGWFFDEPTGPETVQVLQYAARAVQLSDQFGGEREEQFLKRLESVRSNTPEVSNGREIYERFVRPAMLDLLGVAAHYAISSLFDGYHRRDSVYCYRAQLQEVQIFENGRTRLAIGRARITSRITHARLKFIFAVLYFGDHTLRAGIRPCHGEDGFHSFLDQAGSVFSHSELNRCLHIMDEYFGSATYSLKSLFRDERQRIIGQIVDSTLTDMDEVYRRVYHRRAALTNFLSELQVPIPAILRVSAEFVLGNDLRRCLAEEKLDVEHFRKLLDDAQKAGISLAASHVEPAIYQRLNFLLDRWVKKPLDLETVKALSDLVSLARVPPFNVDLWKSQNICYELLLGVSRSNQFTASEVLLAHLRELAERLGIAAELTHISQEQLPFTVRSQAPEHLVDDPKEYAAILSNSSRKPGDEHLPV